MSHYWYELVDRDQGVVQRWRVDHPGDDHALAGLEGIALLESEDESLRVFRDGEEGPFATRTLDFGVEVFA